MQSRIRIFEDIHELLTLRGAAKKSGRGVNEEDLSIIKDAVLVSVNGRLAWVGEKKRLSRKVLDSFGGQSEAEYVSLGQRTVLPGLVEPHTHSVFAGSRAEEFEWRVQGQSYQEIAKQGGGILSTVKQTRAASFEELLSLAEKRAEQFFNQGVTTLEIKSGYGLDTETEIRCLKVARALTRPRIVSTYLGPHSRSPEFEENEDYIRHVCNGILPRIAQERLADRVDIYIEKGFFTPAMARTYFEKAKELGLPISAHVEQLSDSGGADLALEFEPQSLDHVVYIGEETIRKLALSRTTAVLLPASDFYLKMRFPPARELIDAGARVALSTDFNPGTSPSQDVSFVGVLARVEMRMTLPEVICAMTFNAASALGKASEVGSIEVGKLCDFVVLDSSWQELFYAIGQHPVSHIGFNGEIMQKKF